MELAWKAQVRGHPQSYKVSIFWVVLGFREDLLLQFVNYCQSKVASSDLAGPDCLPRRKSRRRL